MEKPDIRLEKLVLRNYKGFYTGDDENGIEITFDKHLTVFIGDNGSGKSAVLDAVALFLAKLRAEITSIGETSSIYPFPPISKEKKNRNVNNEMEEAELDAFFKLFPTVLDEDVERNPRVGFSIGMLKAKSPNEIQTSKWFDHSKLGEEELDTSTNDKKTLEYFLRDNIYDPFLGGEFQDKDRSIPILIYYGANTINMGVYDKLEEVESTIFDTYRDALDANKFSFKQFFAWFDAEKRKLVQRAIEGNAAITDSPNKYIETAIEKMLSDTDIQYSNLDMDWSDSQADMTVMKLNKKLSINQLSSGERTLIALVADLTRRLCLANPNADNPLHGNGIVLIDEIDVHLHPKWQRKVVTKLREVFPNVQFVMTTHSALVISDYNIKPEQVLVLTEEEETRKKTIVSLVELELNNSGVEPNKIYEEIMGVPLRPIEAQKKMDKLSKLLNPLDFESPETQALIQELTERFGTEDSFIRKINHHLKLLNRIKVVA